MRIRIDYSKCSKCGLCLDACPRLADNKDYRIFECSCLDKKCLYSCPKDAIFEIDRIVSIDKNRCNGCGDCSRVCDKKAIVKQKSYFVKCDLCFETGRPKCVEACPKKAIYLEYDQTEKEKIREVVGWRKIKYDVEGKIEDNDGFRVVRVIGKDEPIFSIKIREIGYDEALFISKVMEEIREGSGEYDEGTVKEIIESCCDKNNIFLEEEDKEFIGAQVRREVTGYSVLDDLIDKSCLEEIAVLNEKSPVYVYHKRFGWLETDIQIDSNRKIVDLINKMSRGLGRRVTLQKPRLNADIRFGRIHAAVEPISSGACLTIRKFNQEPFTPYDLITNRTASSEALAFLWLAVQCDFNMLVCGNTGSGKTSTLNTLFSFVPKNERVILIEETPEINLPHRHLVKLVVNEDLKIRLEELITDTLRMRPDRIIVGEVRSAEESRALMNTMLAGQGKGSFSTFHAQNGRDCLVRLKSFGISPVDLCSLDMMVVQRRWTRYSKAPQDIRRIMEIDSVGKEEPKIIKLFEYDQRKDCLKRNSLYGTDVFKKICFNFNFGRKKFEEELRRRSEFLENRPQSFEGFFNGLNRMIR